MTKKTTVELFIIDRVKEKRIANKISQRRLSVDMNLRMSFVGNAECASSPTKYNLNHLNAFAIYFDCELWDFFPDEPFHDKNTKYLEFFNKEMNNRHEEEKGS
ncbi:MAG: XRE family transcriptional regulator [Butyricimonas faecihominis]